MFLSLLAVVGVIAGIFGVAGLIKGGVDAAANNRAASQQTNPADGEVERDPNKVIGKQKEPIKEEPIKNDPSKEEPIEEEIIDDEPIEEVNEKNKYITKEEWVKNNKLDKDALHQTCVEKIEELFPNATKEKKELLTKALETKWGDVVSRIEKSEKITALSPDLSVEKWASNEFYPVLNQISEKFDAYGKFEKETKGKTVQYDSRDKVVVETKSQINNILKNAKKAILNTKEDLDTYLNRIESNGTQVENMLTNIAQFGKIKVNLQEALKTAKTTERKVEVLVDVVKAHGADIKELLSIKQEITNIATSVSTIDEDTKKAIESIEKKVNEDIEKTKKELQTKIANVAKTKVNTATVNSKLSKIEKILDGKASQEDVEKALSSIEELKATFEEGKEKGLTEEDIENIKAVIVQQAVDLTVPQVMEKVTDKVGKIDAKTRKKLVAEAMEAVRSEIAAEVKNIDLDTVANDVIDKITIVNKNNSVKK